MDNKEDHNGQIVEKKSLNGLSNDSDLSQKAFKTRSLEVVEWEICLGDEFFMS